MHNHAPEQGRDSTSRVRLAIALSVTTAVFIAQLVGAVLTNSLSLLVDTAHMVTDAGGLLLAFIASRLVTREATVTHTWGLRRAEVLSAAAQSLVLFAVGIYAVITGLTRLFAPPEVPSQLLLVFGIVGLIGNIVSMLVLASARNHNLNLRAAFLEVINDALGSCAVIISAIVIRLTGWAQVDALAGLFIAALILPRALRILRHSLRVLMEAVPSELDLRAIQKHILENEHVTHVHDLHVTLIGTGLPVLTAHVEVEPTCLENGHASVVLDELQKCAREHFPLQIGHCTFQIEPTGHAEGEKLPHS